MIEIGRICVKTAGREAGKYCVIIDVLGEGMLMVTGPKAVTRVKRRKCSIQHVEPTPELVKLKKNATDDEVIEAYKHSGIYKRIGAEEPKAKDIEKAKEAERKRVTEAKSKPKAEEKKAQEAPKEEKKQEAKKEPAPKEKKAQAPRKKAQAKKKPAGKAKKK